MSRHATNGMGGGGGVCRRGAKTRSADIPGYRPSTLNTTLDPSRQRTLPESQLASLPCSVSVMKYGAASTCLSTITSPKLLFDSLWRSNVNISTRTILS